MAANKKINNLSLFINDKLRLFFSISFGVFLFVLFFQPFPINKLDFNNSLLFLAGLAGITFLSIFLVHITIFLGFPKSNIFNKYSSIHQYISSAIILIISSVAFAFYLRFVGKISITLYTMFKIILVCMAPPVILSLFNKINGLKHENELLHIQNKTVREEVDKYEEDYQNKMIEFISDNATENLKLAISEIAFVKSADNYVEIVYKEGLVFKKTLIRNTLKNIEHQLKQYSIFIRCHRTCIVNTFYVEKLNRQYNNYWLSIKEYDIHLPVSRQYLLSLKETI